MNAPSSRPPDERFAEWVDGCMSQRDRERFEAELRVNATLRAELAAYERTVATLREALQAPTAPTNLADRVLPAVQAASRAAPGSPGPRQPRSFGTYLFGGLAAAALMAVAVWFDAWVTPTGQVDKVAQVDPAAVGAPPPATAPVEDLAGTGGAADAPAAEKGKEPLRQERLETDAAKPAAGNAADVEEEKQQDPSREGAQGLAKNPEADAKDRGPFGARGEPKPVAVSGGMLDEPAARSQAAESQDLGRRTEAPVPAPAAPVASPQPIPGGAVRGVAEPGEVVPLHRDVATPEAEGKPDAGGRPDAAGGAREVSGAPSAPPGALAGSGEASPSNEGPPTVGSRGGASRSRAPASPFAGPLPFLTVDRSAPSPTVPPPADGATKGGESRARFAEGAQEDLAQLVDRFLATAGAGDGDEIVWRTARGALVLRAVDPALLAQPGERDALRADPRGPGGGGGAPAAPLPAPRAWLLVGDPADIEVLLARLGAKVRAEGWRLQTGEFEGPKAPQGQKLQGPAGPAAGATGAQRSLLLRFRFVR